MAEIEVQLTPDELRTIAYYTHDGHVAINADLRGDGDGELAVVRHIAVLDALFERMPLFDTMTVYRGIDRRYAELLEDQGLTVGDIIVETAFLSTSTDRTVARRFMGYEDGGMTMRIVVPSGSRAIDLARFSVNGDESEVLIARGTRLSVVGYDADADMLDVEVLPDVR